MRVPRMARLEHLVVQDIFATETAILADVVLPASAFAEKWGSVTNTDRLIQIGRPALKPPGQARQDLWAIEQIGAPPRPALGLLARGGRRRPRRRRSADGSVSTRRCAR